MSKRNLITFGSLLVIFLLAALVIFPMSKGELGGRGVRLGLDLQGGIDILYKADLTGITSSQDQAAAIDGVMAVLSNRINPLGVTEPLIQKQGTDRIRVQLPGLSISDQDKERLSSVALLEFGEQTTDDDPLVKWDLSKWGEGKWKPATGTLNGQTVKLTSRFFKTNTFVDRDTLGAIHLRFEWDADGSQLSKEVTTRLLNKPLGIFEADQPMLGEDGRPITPVVQAVITESGEITGLSYQEALTLSRQLNAGRLPVPLTVLSDQTVSPVLGSDFVSMSLRAGLIGIAIVMVFMIAYYRVSGVVANLALIFYAALNMALFKLIPVTLTLAGLAGFIVSLGMAVDANVLIFERMKEELISGKTFGAAVEAGFKRAWSAIWDSNLTTFIACIVLFWLGGLFSEAMKGFAVTLFIGVAVSMFTAVLVSRTLLRLLVGSSLATQVRLFSPHLGGR